MCRKGKGYCTNTRENNYQDPMVRVVDVRKSDASIGSDTSMYYAVNRFLKWTAAIHSSLRE